VEVLIRLAMKERGLSFKEALNSALRVGLSETKLGKTPFVQKTFALGSEQLFRWDRAFGGL
jgi:hypothetical protein